MATADEHVHLVLMASRFLRPGLGPGWTRPQTLPEEAFMALQVHQIALEAVTALRRLMPRIRRYARSLAVQLALA